MTIDRNVDIPVLVAGGGPVGMTLALELARYGVPSILVEQNPSTTRHPKMDITNGRSMELFRRLGVVDRLRAVGVPQDNPFDVAWVTSLVGHELHRFRYPTPNEARRLIRRVNDGSQASEPPLRVSQVVIEPVLKTAIDENPLVDVRFGVRFNKIIRHDVDGVISEVVSSEGKSELIRSMYLAGCDGGGSQVRREIGVKLDGEFNFARAFMVHFRSDDRELLQRWGTTWHYQTATGSLIAQNDEDIWTLQAWILPGMDETQMTAEGVLEGWAGKSFDYEILEANPWGAHFVVAEGYAEGRVALAGDAAHQYVPTGGYGMNSGIGDAAGLGWVLAALAQGWGGAELLRAYDIERRPVAWSCLAASKRHMGVRLAIGAVYAESGDLESAAPGAAERRKTAGDRIGALGNAENESWGVELGYRYDGSPVIRCEAEAPPVDPLIYAGSTSPGGRLPHVFLEDGSPLHDNLGLYFTLVATEDRPTDIQAFKAAAAILDVPLEVFSTRSEAVKKVIDHSLVLVRPDQHIAWRGHQAPADCRSLMAQVVGFASNAVAATAGDGVMASSQ